MPRPAPGRAHRARRRLVGLALVLLVPLASCQSADEPASAPERLSRNDAQATLTSHPAPTRTGIHRVHGRLPVARRKAVRRQVGAVVDRWWEASYLGGTYPRSRFPAAFPGFTAAAEQRARADKALLTNQTGGPRIESVTPRKRRITLDILATGGRARAVTAHFVLAFDTTGPKTGTTTVRGRLFLTHKRGAWRIFGYDVAKGAR
ncbi:hypothetical protein [Nocardioides sp. zg-1228]|uniref:hypothetical protein n=1 Tax=Nocardioides sp. zg-1228 TaxID=2763008 RepID=UPI001642AFDE|nr:hypothetical protein [Nocardioides sp. zg-1228]MBC2934064.1 hypothetical protein [Nocardioides sp. zg-1228]QSF58816.1 hypothetical protein JX575_06445 [Nocardioides sp. zg-1228]